MPHFHADTSPEVVFLFQGDDPARELLYPEFEAILDGFIPIPEYAGLFAKAVYAQFNAQLKITGAVFFLLGFDGGGMADRRWNIPLRQLLAAAGPGPDMGAGAIRLVCYSQCPLAWQQKNLWDPSMEPERNSFIALARAMEANRMGLAPAAGSSAAGSSAATPTPSAIFSPEPDVSLKGDISLEADISPEPEPLDIPTLVHEVAPEGWEPERALAAQLEQQRQQLDAQYRQVLQDKLALVTKEQRLRLATLNSDMQARLQAMQREHQQRLENYREQVKQLEDEKQRLATRNESLRADLRSQLDTIDAMRSDYARELQAIKEGESGQVQALKDSFDTELEMRLLEAGTQLREMLDMRDMELFYSRQNESVLKEEITRLKQEAQTLLGSGADQLLGRLVKTGVHFVTLQAGVGELNIPQQDISRYLDKPTAYLAQQAGVSEAIYLAWREHFNTPCCSGNHGKACGEPLARVDNPLAFIPGESDRCNLHQRFRMQRVGKV